MWSKVKNKVKGVGVDEFYKVVNYLKRIIIIYNNIFEEIDCIKFIDDDGNFIDDGRLLIEI